MNRRHLLISLAVAAVVIIFVAVIFTRNSTAPDAEGSTTADTLGEQVALPAGPANDPAETTNSN